MAQAQEMAGVTYPEPPGQQPWEPIQPITDDQGRAAMKYIKPAQIVVLDKYVFTVMWNVSLAYIEPDDIARLFGVRAKACCGKKSKRAFYYANETDVAHHEGRRP